MSKFEIMQIEYNDANSNFFIELGILLIILMYNSLLIFAGFSLRPLREKSKLNFTQSPPRFPQRTQRY